MERAKTNRNGPADANREAPAAACEPIEVAVLLGHAHVSMALDCVASLATYSADALRFVVHDDGSLAAEDRERLAERLGAVRFLARDEADDRLAGELAGRPALSRFRAANPLALKLIDAPLLADGERLSYCDSDVLFRRPFRGLFRAATDAVFMSDLDHAYSVRSWHLLVHRRLRLPCRVNTGIVCFPRAGYDLDLLEWFLRQPRLQRPPVWAEQTGWALLGRRAGCRRIDPRQALLPVEGWERLDPVAVHFVSPLRARLTPALAGGSDRRGEPPLEIALVPAGRLNAPGLLLAEIRRRMRHLARPQAAVR